MTSRAIRPDSTKYFRYRSLASMGHRLWGMEVLPAGRGIESNPYLV
jgi:hypothetical protein